MSEMVERFWSKVERAGEDECWPWTGTVNFNRSGLPYGMFRDGKMRRANRVAWEINNGKSVPPGLVVRHTCDNTICCNPKHLVTGTQQQNVFDRDERNRSVYLRGDSHANAKLKESDIPKIRALLAQGVSQRKVAMQFGVSQYPISAIARGEAWNHVR